MMYARKSACLLTSPGRRAIGLLLAGLALCLISFTDIVAGGQPPAKQAIVPHGIDGALVLCGEGEISKDALEQFCAMAGGKNGRVVVVRSRESAKIEQALTQRLLESWEAKNLESFAIVRVPLASGENAEELKQLTKATAVWLAAGNDGNARQMLANTPL